MKVGDLITIKLGSGVALGIVLEILLTTRSGSMSPDYTIRLLESDGRIFNYDIWPHLSEFKVLSG